VITTPEMVRKEIKRKIASATATTAREGKDRCK